MHMRYGMLTQVFELLNLVMPREQNSKSLVERLLCSRCVWLRFVEIVVVSQKQSRTGNPPQSLFLIGQLRKVETPTLPVLASPLQPLGLALCESCSLPPFLAMFAWRC